MLACEHLVDDDAYGIDVGPLVRLGKAILLRRGVPGGTQQPGVRACAGLGHPGGVKVDQHRIATPQQDVLRLDIPVDDPRMVELGEGLAQLHGDPLHPGRRERPGLQQKGQRVPADILLQYIYGIAPGFHIIDLRKIWAGDAPQALVDRIRPREPAVDVAFPRFVVHQADAAVAAGFQRPFQHHSGKHLLDLIAQGTMPSFKKRTVVFSVPFCKGW